MAEDTVSYTHSQGHLYAIVFLPARHQSQFYLRALHDSAFVMPQSISAAAQSQSEEPGLMFDSKKRGKCAAISRSLIGTKSKKQITSNSDIK